MTDDCRFFSKQFKRCLLGELSAEETLQLKNHLESCGTCMDMLQETRKKIEFIGRRTILKRKAEVVLKAYELKHSRINLA